MYACDIHLPRRRKNKNRKQANRKKMKRNPHVVYDLLQEQSEANILNGMMTENANKFICERLKRQRATTGRECK